MTACLSGSGTQRRRGKAELLTEAGYKPIDLAVTVSPVPAERGLAVLVLEDVTEIMALRQIIPICSHCRKMRSDASYWQHVEAYLHDQFGADLSHGICPECRRIHYPEYCGASADKSLAAED